MIFEIYIWILSFISVFVALWWVIVNYISKNRIVKNNLKEFPKITVAIPIYNEEKTIIQTLKCIFDQDYPQDKLELIIVEDKGNDNTVKVLNNFIKKNKIQNILLLKHSKNIGKAGALNTALKKATGEYFWVYDADSFASKDLLKNMIYRFYEPNNKDVAAVVAITLIKNEGSWIEKMQRLEYVMASFVRKLMGAVDTLHITNALSLFKTKVLKKVGGFDVGNLTEDFEIAMRLRYQGYRIVMCEKGRFHTDVPNTIKGVWMQRVRWFRGFIFNNLKYKKMVLNRKFGLLGLFQIPIEVFFLIAVFVSIALFGYHIINFIIDIIFQVYIMRFALFEFTIPTLKQVILDINWRLAFPSFVVLMFGLYLYFEAHRYVGEKWKFYIPSLLYLFVYPMFRSMQWLHAFVLEFSRAERKW